jgi:hypothetical protein
VFITMKAAKRGPSAVITQKHRKPKRARKEALQLMDDAIDAACSQDVSFNSSSSNECECKAVITSLKQEVAELKAQVDFLLDFFNLKQVNRLPTTADQSQQMKPPDTATTNNPPTTDGYSKSVSSRSKPASVLSAPLRQAVLSAVYSDLSAKNNRSTNVVLSGIPPESTRADKDIVVDLIARELHIQTAVRVCRRLGRPTPGRIQPLCATLSSAVEVDQVLGCAKLLRSSSQSYVRDKIFINRDFTRAEAQAAYENRCRLRARRAAASSSSSNPTNILPTTSSATFVNSTFGDHDRQACAQSRPTTWGTASTVAPVMAGPSFSSNQPSPPTAHSQLWSSQPVNNANQTEPVTAAASPPAGSCA